MGVTGESCRGFPNPWEFPGPLQNPPSVPGLTLQGLSPKDIPGISPSYSSSVPKPDPPAPDLALPGVIPNLWPLQEPRGGDSAPGMGKGRKNAPRGGGCLGIPGGNLGVAGGNLGIPGGNFGIPGGNLAMPGGCFGDSGFEAGCRRIRRQGKEGFGKEGEIRDGCGALRGPGSRRSRSQRFSGSSPLRPQHPRPGPFSRPVLPGSASPAPPPHPDPDRKSVV